MSERFTPENFQIVLAFPPAHSNAMTTNCNAVCLKGAAGVAIIVQEHAVADTNEITYTVSEGDTAAVAEAGTYPLVTGSASARGSDFLIWANLKAQTNDVMVRKTDAVTWVSPAYVAGDDIVLWFYVPASVLTAGRDWIHLIASAGDAANFISAIYILDGLRYQQTTVPEATS